MATIQNKVIHRFIRAISEYEEGGLYHNRVIPVDTQAYAFYPYETPDSNSYNTNQSNSGNQKYGLYYVFGDGNHTYTEIRDGKGDSPAAREYPVFTPEDFGTKIDTLIAGANVVITGSGNVRTIAVPGVPVPDRFISDQILPDDLNIGDEIKNLDGTQAIAVSPPASLKINDIVIFASAHQLLVTYVDPTETLYDGAIIYAPQPEDEISFANLKGQPTDNAALKSALNKKLEKKNTPNKIYAIDDQGNQVLLSHSEVGIKDAPIDGQEYLRKDGTWSKLNLSNVINDTVPSLKTTYSSIKIEKAFEEVKNIIADLNVLNIVIVDSLPEVGEARTLYFVPSKKYQSPEKYDEYMWIDNAWEAIGVFSIDLNGYVTDSELQIAIDKVNEAIKNEEIRALSAEEKLAVSLRTAEDSINKLNEELDLKQNKLIAGPNIKIEKDVISATSAVVSVNGVLPDESGDITLTKADVGLGNVNNTSDLDKPISAATLYVLDALNQKVNKKQNTLTAGSNIEITEENVINAVDLVTSYTQLTDKPKINDVELNDNVSLDELGIQPEGDYQLVSNLSQELDTSTEKYPSNNAVYIAISEKDSLPPQENHSGEYLVTDGSIASWVRLLATDEELNAGEIETLVPNVKQIRDRFVSVNNTINVIRDQVNLNTSNITKNTQNIATITETLENKADKATTLSGYGITDAYTKLWIDTHFVDRAIYENNLTTINNSLNNLDTVKANKDEVNSALAKKQNILTAGNHITIDNSLISAYYQYEDLTDKPSINNVVLTGNISLEDLGLQPAGNYATKEELTTGLATKQNVLTAGDGIILENDVISVVNNIDSYNDLIDKPSINNIELVGNKTLSDLGIQEKGDYADAQDLIDETNRAMEAETLLSNMVTNLTKNISIINKDLNKVKSDIKKKQDKLIPGYGIRLENNVIEVDLSEESGGNPDESYTEESGSESGYEPGGESGYIPDPGYEDYITRDEYELKCKEYEDQIDALENRLERIIDLVTKAGFMIVGVDDTANL